jgi:hypothetical protein
VELVEPPSAWLKEIAFRQGWIDLAKLNRLAANLPKTRYRHLKALADSVDQQSDVRGREWHGVEIQKLSHQSCRHRHHRRHSLRVKNPTVRRLCKTTSTPLVDIPTCSSNAGCCMLEMVLRDKTKHATTKIKNTIPRTLAGRGDIDARSPFGFIGDEKSRSSPVAEHVVALTLSGPPAQATHWTAAMMAR